MAAPTIYICPTDFPPKIPAISAMGGFVACLDKDRFPRVAALKSGFCYRISDGRNVVDVLGSSEEDGTISFYVVERWSWNFRRRSSRRDFRIRIIALLLREGAQVLTVEMVLEADQKRASRFET